MIENISNLKDHVVYVVCGNYFYYGTITSAGCKVLHLADADLYILNAEGEMLITPLQDRDTIIAVDKITAIMENDHEEETTEDPEEQSPKRTIVR